MYHECCIFKGYCWKSEYIATGHDGFRGSSKVGCLERLGKYIISNIGFRDTFCIGMKLRLKIFKNICYAKRVIRSIWHCTFNMIDKYSFRMKQKSNTLTTLAVCMQRKACRQRLPLVRAAERLILSSVKRRTTSLWSSSTVRKRRTPSLAKYVACILGCSCLRALTNRSCKVHGVSFFL